MIDYNKQIELLQSQLAKGFIDQALYKEMLFELMDRQAKAAESSSSGGTSITNSGTGAAISTGSGTAVGSRGVNVGDRVTGAIITGTGNEVQLTTGGTGSEPTLQTLLTQLRAASESGTAEQQAAATEAVQHAEVVVTHAEAQQTESKWYQVNKEGLQKAAENLATVAPAIGRIVAQILSQLG